MKIIKCPLCKGCGKIKRGTSRGEVVKILRKAGLTYPEIQKHTGLSLGGINHHLK